MPQVRALTGNAADPKQVQYAARKEKDRAARFATALSAVLATPAGRVVCWELLRRAGIFESIWDPSAKIHYNAGRQDYGHRLLADCVETDEEAYQLMEREARAWERREARETAAVQQQATAEMET